MKAFLSYTHRDLHYLERLKVHLAPMKREHVITEWTDHEIKAGQNLNTEISEALLDSQLFISLLSPDYLASQYCYDIEFKKAQTMQEEGRLIIIPLVVEPCDWQKTPFGNLKAVPRDGKAVSEWTNENNAFLNVIDELRRIVSAATPNSAEQQIPDPTRPKPLRNYKVKKLFSAVDEVNFREDSFRQIKSYFKSAIEEINMVQDIQSRFIRESDESFTCLISNRSNSQDRYITVYHTGSSNGFHSAGLQYLFAENLSPNTFQADQSFTVRSDEYEQHWAKNNMSWGPPDRTVYSANEVASEIWEKFISEVGIS